jgi:hypothetical protein
MNDPQPVSLKDRMRALLAIPDSQRTDAEWDELNEIEITLASSNQLSNPEPGVRRGSGQSDGGRRSNNPQQGQGQGQPGQGQPRPPGSGQNKKPFRKFRKRPPKEGGGGQPQQ